MSFRTRAFVLCLIGATAGGLWSYTKTPEEIVVLLGAASGAVITTWLVAFLD